MPNGTITLVRTTWSTAAAQELRWILRQPKLLLLRPNIVEAAKLYKKTQDDTLGSFFNLTHYRYLRGELEKHLLYMLGSNPVCSFAKRVLCPRHHRFKGQLESTYFPQASRKKTRKIREEMRSGAFHFGNRCTGISSISRAARRPPRSTGTNPRPRIKSSTDSLAEWTSPA